MLTNCAAIWVLVKGTNLQSTNENEILKKKPFKSTLKFIIFHVVHLNIVEI